MRSAVVFATAILVFGGIARATPRTTEPGDHSRAMGGPGLETAKDIVRAALGTLGPADVVAVVGYTDEAEVVVPLQRADHPLRIPTQLLDLTLSGHGSNMFPGLREAFDILQGVSASAKHVILVGPAGPIDGVPELVEDMRGALIHVSTVCPAGADRDTLAMIADAGGGTAFLVDGPVLPNPVPALLGPPTALP